MKIHLVFHISLLKPADPDVLEGLTPKLHPSTQQEEYKVEAILDVRLRRRKLQWLVKWLKYGNEENTWELKENLKNCQSVLNSFYRTN
jgi:Chromo (CHRromatin Organisation MOdifier) domain